MHAGDGGLVAFVAVVERLAEQPVAAEQAVVDGPRVDADRRRTRLLPERVGEALREIAVQAGEVPVQPRREPHGVVREPGDVLELERCLHRGRRRGRG